jgi:hypothetical protein
VAAWETLTIPHRLPLPSPPERQALLAACLALFELYYGEVGGEIIGAAGDRAQAALAFDIARKMVDGLDDRVSAPVACPQ